MLLFSSVSARTLQSEEAAVKAIVAKAKASGGYKTTKPLIGILTQPCHECPGRWASSQLPPSLTAYSCISTSRAIVRLRSRSYVAAGYVKWIEAAGGRAVPIRQAPVEQHCNSITTRITRLLTLPVPLLQVLRIR